VSVCPRAYLWNRWTDLHEILCAVPLLPWLAPPLAALQYVMMYCGFMDNVTFGRNGPYGDAIPGRSLVSMNALLVLHFALDLYNRENVCNSYLLYVN